MICAACGEATEGAPCAACGGEPLLEGHYRLEAELGRGSSGTTFRAVDVRSGVAVAIKEMPLGRASSAKARELVDREAAVLSQLDHPGIPGFLESRVVGSGRNQAVMLVQELVPGEDLERHLRGHRYRVDEALQVARDLLSILVYLHGLSPPVVHRDLKPGNVMRRPDGALVLLDFGAVRDSLRDLDGSGSTVAGTFGYMAPEQLVGDATPISDLYALGALLVHLLTRTDPQQLLSVQGGLDWEGRVSVPTGVRDLLRDLLVPDPDERRRRLGDTRAVLRRVEVLLAEPRAARPPVPAVVETRTPLVQVQVPVSGPAAARLGLVAGVVVALVVAGLGAFVAAAPSARAPEAPAAVDPLLLDEPPPARAAAPFEPPVAPPPPPARRVESPGVGDLPALGTPGAPVSIVVFSDYQCPYCAKLDGIWDQLVAQREGQVAIHFRDFPLDMHQNARRAALAGRCADAQGRHLAMHRAMYADQRHLDPEGLDEMAREAGLDPGEFRACLDAQTHASAVERDVAAGRALGVTGTPTSFVNGEIVGGAQPLSAFLAAVDRALAER